MALLSLTDDLLLDKCSEALAGLEAPNFLRDEVPLRKMRLISSPRYEESITGISAFLDAFCDAYYKSYLSPFVRFLRQNEIFLSQVKPLYRDHFKHSISVFNLGMFLAMKVPAYQSNIRRLLGETSQLGSGGYVILPWGIAALFHDLARIFQEMKDLLPLTFAVGVKSEACLSYWSSFLFFLGDTRAAVDDRLETLDHGAVSAIWLLDRIRALSYPGDQERSSFESRIFPAAEAIALHNCSSNPTQNVEIDVRTRPIAHLLVLCDELQEWERFRNVDQRQMEEPGICGRDSGFPGSVAWLADTNVTVSIDQDLLRENFLEAEIDLVGIRGPEAARLFMSKEESLRRLRGLEGRIVLRSDDGQKTIHLSDGMSISPP